MGDTLVEDEDGSMRHLGRSDDLFKVDARWVSPSQVEGALLGHPAVAEAAVVGVDDDEGLIRPAAHVVLAAGRRRRRRPGRGAAPPRRPRAGAAHGAADASRCGSRSPACPRGSSTGGALREG